MVKKALCREMLGKVLSSIPSRSAEMSKENSISLLIWDARDSVGGDSKV
jgi:hypothetical protein